MFYILILAALIFFVTHVGLLLTSFPQAKLARKRYFYSHLTLWLTGGFVFMLVVLYSGSGQSGFLDYFDSTNKKIMILVFTFGLSLLAHAVVKLVVLPLMSKN
ncbi:hypothetical protein ACXZ1K_18475 [Pedobacter sp. PWIIR3]